MKVLVSKSCIAILFSFLYMHQTYAQTLDSIPREYVPITFEVANQSNKLFDYSLKNSVSTSIMVNKKSKLPLFCDLEHRMEVKSNIPVRFRIGNLDYVNKLEGKD